MIKSIDVNMAEFMREIDASVQLSRDIFSQWDAVHNEISVEEWEAIQLKVSQIFESSFFYFSKATTQIPFTEK